MEIEVHAIDEQREPLVQQKVSTEAQQPPANIEGGREAAAPPGDEAAQQQPLRNQPNCPGNQAGINLLERLTDTLECV